MSKSYGHRSLFTAMFVNGVAELPLPPPGGREEDPAGHLSSTLQTTGRWWSGSVGGSLEE